MTTDLTKRDVGTLQWLTIREAASRLKCSADTAIRRIVDRQLHGAKFGHQWRVHVSNFRNGRE